MTVVAIDSDKNATRVAVAERRAGGAVVTHVATVDGGGDAAAVAGRVRDALPGVRWAKAKLVVTVGGERVSLRVLNLPPTPDGELPDMVALVGEREFGAADPGVVDYVPLGGDESTPRTVLAARVSDSTVSEARKLAESLGASLSRVTLRGCSAASAAIRIDPTIGEGGCLVLAPAGEATDLIALADGAPAVVRTALGEVAADGSEVRRTLSAATLQTGAKTNRVVALGTQVSLEPLVEQGLAGDAAAVAGPIGAAIDEAAGARPAFDLLNPRRVTRDAAPQRRQLLLAGLAAVVLLFGLFSGYWSLTKYQRQADDLDTQRAALERRAETFEPLAERAIAIDGWKATDVNWLDELELLARDLRPSPLSDPEFAVDDDVMLSQFTATAQGGRSGAGGQIVLDAVARDADTPTLVEERLRDGRREVTQGPLDRSGARPYPWRFKPTVKIGAPLAADSQSDAGNDDEGVDSKDDDTQDTAEETSA